MVSLLIKMRHFKLSYLYFPLTPSSLTNIDYFPPPVLGTSHPLSQMIAFQGNEV